MNTSYIGAFERIRLGADDKRILSYGKVDNISKQLRNWLNPGYRTSERGEKTANEDWYSRRVMELKAIIQRNHPDKPFGNIARFRAAKEELAKLRNR